MGREDYKKYFDVLEISLRASFLELKMAYRHLKRLYSEESFITAPIAEEFWDDNKDAILKDIEEAYSMLSILYEKFGSGQWSSSVISEIENYESQEKVGEIEIFSGLTLHRIRKKLEIDLADLAYATKVSKFFLHAIETEDYKTLPQEVYIRGYVMSYAKCLSLDPDKVVNDYMKRYHQWKADLETATY